MYGRDAGTEGERETVVVQGGEVDIGRGRREGVMDENGGEE